MRPVPGVILRCRHLRNLNVRKGGSVSKQTNEDKQAAVRSRLYLVQTIKHNGVPIEIKPLRYGLVPEATDFLWELGTRAQSGRLDREFIQESFGQLNGYLNQCVAVPDDPELTVEDLPFDVIPAILDVFIEQTLKPGNWKSLAQSMNDKFGVDLLVVMGQGNPAENLT